MLRQFAKLGVLVIVGISSWQVASTTINQMVIEVHSRQKTIADALIQQQVQEAFKKADAEIEKVQKEQNIIIQTEEVVIKPPLPEKEEKPKVEEKPAISEEEQTERVDNLVEEEKLDTSVENTDEEVVLDMNQYADLTQEDIEFLSNYLIEHYFLYGYDYYQAEKDPIRYERKKLASDMEDCVINSLWEAFGLLQNFQNITSEQLKPIKEQTSLLAADFKSKYQNVGEKGPEFQSIYDAINAFFDTYSHTLDVAVSTFDTLKDTTNQMLVIPLLFKRINQDLLPSVAEVLNKGFELKEKTNAIYIEGIEDSKLITKDEVMKIIDNPHFVLPPKSSTTTSSMPSEETSTEQGAMTP